MNAPSSHASIIKDSSLFQSVLTSEVVVLAQKDIDTDLIIPAQFLKTITKTGLGQHVFFNLKKDNPHFPKFSGKHILLAGDNFGCGSSREHAVWALKDAGIHVIIAPSFADIFQGNAEKNELLTITLDAKIIDSLMQNPRKISVNLQEQKVIEDNGQIYEFDIAPFTKRRFIERITDLDYLLSLEDKIRAFDARQKSIFSIKGTL